MSLTSPTSIVLALSMHQSMVQHQVSLVHHYCDTFHAPQQSNINSHTLRQNNIKSTVGYRQILTTRLGSLGQNMPAGYTLGTNSVFEPGQTNTDKITSISLGNGYEMEVLTPRDSKLSKQLCFLFFCSKRLNYLKLFKVNHYMVCCCGYWHLCDYLLLFFVDLCVSLTLKISLLCFFYVILFVIHWSYLYMFRFSFSLT